MIASHGRPGRAWLLTALAVTAAGSGPVAASQVVYEARPIDRPVPAAGPAQHASGGPAVLHPSAYLPPIAPPQGLTPSPASAAHRVVATASTPLPTSTPAIADWHSDDPVQGTPALPPCAAPKPAGPGHVTPPAPASVSLLKPPASLEVLPTPEPSSALVALTLAGALAWRRRRAVAAGR